MTAEGGFLDFHDERFLWLSTVPGRNVVLLSIIEMVLEVYSVLFTPLIKEKDRKKISGRRKRKPTTLVVLPNSEEFSRFLTPTLQNPLSICPT